MAAHLVFVLLVRVVSDQVAAYYADEIDWSRYRVEVLRLRVPEPIYYHPAEGNSVADSRAERARAGAERPHGVEMAHASRRSPIPQGIELPPLPRTESDTAVLRPDTSVESQARSGGLPSLAFWARRDPLSPSPRPKDIVEPGRAEPDSPAARSGARPSAQIPNREANQADLNIPAAPQNSNSLLPVPPSAATPLRDRASESRGGVFDVMAGQPANVIVLSQSPRLPGQIVTLPPGSRGARSEQTAGAAAGESAGGSLGPTQAGKPDATRAGSASSEVEQTRKHNALEAANTSIKAPQTAAPPSGADAFVRIMHPPGGSFDVVVTHSGDRPEIAGVTRGLSGSPVYSAYIAVGEGREWVLAYCLPASRDVRESRYSVYVEAAVPISAPFPITTLVRSASIAGMRPRPMTFHGFLTADGTFRNLQPEESTPAARDVASTLDEWRFRPARRGETPVEVEVLLILPATTERPDRQALGNLLKNTALRASVEAVKRGAAGLE